MKKKRIVLRIKSRRTFAAMEEVITSIKHAILRDEFEHYGIRVLEEETLVQPGDELRPSRVWEDGEPTGETLDGVGTVWIDTSDPEDLDREIRVALENTSPYFGGQLVLVGGNFGNRGRDPDEYVIADPHVIASFYRPSRKRPAGRRRPPPRRPAGNSEEMGS